MIVTRETFHDEVSFLSQADCRAFDTETTGLNAYKSDYLFALIIADKDKEYYFNFQSYEGLSEDKVLPREWLKLLRPIFDNPNSYWFAHNAKFDLSMLWREGIEVQGTVHCTLAIARVEYNGHLSYSLSDCAARIGLQKDDAVEKYIKDHKLYDWENQPGKKTRSKKKFFDRVPIEIMQPYGEKDARVAYELGKHQVKSINEIANTTPSDLPSIRQVYENEKKLTKTCFAIERTGILIDKEYCEKAIAHETENLRKAEADFLQITGYPLTNSGKSLAGIFSSLGEKFPTTAKGNPSFTEAVLETLTSPAALSVRAYRKAEKRLNTYFRNFLYFADKDGFVHASIKQGGTETGRFSYGEPNLQNLPKRGEDDKEFPVRRAFIPRTGYFFVMLDYDQMEYKMMADYAGETVLIDKILGGLDVHEACMQIMGMTKREPAKTINFMLLYGGGVAKLAMALFEPTVSEKELFAIGRLHLYQMHSYPEYAEHRALLETLPKEVVDYNFGELLKAKALFDTYFERLPKVQELIKRIQNTAKDRKYIFNWFGRRCHFKNQKYCYAAPNHLIQGGGADVVKVAMNRIDDFLKGKRSRMLVQVHDELLFEIHDEERDIIPELKLLMEQAYPYRRLPLTCGVEHSFKSWGDKIEGIPE